MEYPFSVAQPSRLRVYGASSPRFAPGDETSPELAGEDARATIGTVRAKRIPDAGKGEIDELDAAPQRNGVEMKDLLIRRATMSPILSACLSLCPLRSLRLNCFFQAQKS